MSNIEIKIATLEDVEELGKMHYESSKKHINTFNPDMPVSLADMVNITKNIINNPRAVLIKATIENTICGCLFLWIIESEEAKIWNNEDEHIGHISEIYVKEEYRQQKIASKMIQFAEDYLKQRNIYGLDLEVYKFNREAYELYKKQGFEEIKTYMHKELK
jgi:ribosomal protein S18 acetylase RimI-like enzyme